MYILHKMTKVSNKLTFICRSVSIYVVIDLVFFILIDHHIGAFYINMRSVGQNLKTIVSCFVHIIHCDCTLSHKSSTGQVIQKYHFLSHVMVSNFSSSIFSTFQFIVFFSQMSSLLNFQSQIRGRCKIKKKKKK